MKSTLEKIIDEFFTVQLAGKAYYSEATVQHKLGIEIYKQLKVESELEKPINGHQAYLDLYTEYASTRYGIELKYKTRAVPSPGYHYKTHAAQNNGKYDFVRDISRLEGCQKRREIERGFAILITNDPLYWSPAKPETHAEEFNLHDGRELQGTLTPGWLDRNISITLHGQYSINWSKPKTSANGIPFRYCLIVC